MAHTYAQDIGDVVKFYHREFITGKNYIDTTRQYRKYDVADDFARAKMRSKDGRDFRHALMVDGYDNGQFDSFFQPDSLTRQNLGQEAVSVWSIYKNGWIVDRREPGWPRGASARQIVDHLAMQRHNMMNKTFEVHQRAKWTLATAPNDGSGSAILPHGIPYYIVQSSTAAVGPNGGHPSGYNSVSGLSRTTYPQLKNYTGTYSSVSHTDFCAQASEMIDKMQWVAPKANPNEETPRLDYVMESHYQPYQEYQTLAIGSNDNIGADQGKYRGAVPAGSQMFRGIPWNWNDSLTSTTLRDGTANAAYDANRPVYFLDKSTWEIIGAEGFFMLESPPVQQDNPHNVIANHLDLIYQRICLNPAGNGVLRIAG